MALTRFPGLGIIFFLECSLRFSNGEDQQDIHKTENSINSIAIRDKWLAIG